MADFAENVEDLRIWQEARRLANCVFDETENLRQFGFKDQIQNASTSVMNNVSEGFERRTKKDFAHFLDIAKGSSGETRSMLYLAEDRKFISSENAERLRRQYKDLSHAIGALASKLRKS